MGNAASLGSGDAAVVSPYTLRGRNAAGAVILDVAFKTTEFESVGGEERSGEQFTLDVPMDPAVAAELSTLEVWRDGQVIMSRSTSDTSAAFAPRAETQNGTTTIVWDRSSFEGALVIDATGNLIATDSTGRVAIVENSGDVTVVLSDGVRNTTATVNIG